MEKNISLITKLILLALPVYLLRTADGVVSALSYALILVSISFIIKAIYLNFGDKIGDKDNILLKPVIIAIGFSLALLFSSIINKYYGSTISNFNFYYLLIGVTPLVYADLSKNKNKIYFINHFLFIDLMLTISILREIFGQGSILNYKIFSTAPFPLILKPAGALMTIAITAILYEFIFNKFEIDTKIKSISKYQSESGV